MPQSFFRRALRRTVTLTVTAGVIAAAGAAVTIGAQELSVRADAAQPVGTADLIPVRATPLILADGFTVTRRFVGRIEAAQSTDLGFEFGGRATEILFDEGARVRAGEVVARQDTALLEAEVARLEASRTALEAQLGFAELSTERRGALQERGFASKEAFDEARFTVDELTARIAETDAAIRATAIRIEKATLTAPYDGTVGARLADPGAILAAGQPVVTLMADAAPMLRVGLPLDLTLAPGDTVQAEVGGILRTARLTALRPDIDDRTRTRTALFALSGVGPAAWGQTATVVYEARQPAQGTWVPTRALRGGADGLWTVLVVDEAQQVRPAAVEVLHAEAGRSFVRGSFAPGTLLIDTGAHRVTPGQTVRVLGGA